MNDVFESSDWISFDRQIEIMFWGEKVYTVLKIPEDVLRTIDQFSSKRVDLRRRQSCGCKSKIERCNNHRSNKHARNVFKMVHIQSVTRHNTQSLE